MIASEVKEQGQLFVKSSRTMSQKIDRLKKERDSLKKLCREQKETIRRYRAAYFSVSRRYAYSTEPW